LTDPGGHADVAYLLEEAGPAAPPRDNGELVFAAPWESQAFGVAMALHEAGAFDWEDFRRQLIAEIGAWEAAGRGREDWSYYRCWLRALERLLNDRGLVAGEDLRARAVLLAARPADHGPPAHRHGHVPGDPGPVHAR
jgi:nitrile hydratase accessory protein